MEIEGRLRWGGFSRRDFNEAMIFRPWKLPRERFPANLQTHFNEAMIFRPWKYTRNGAKIAAAIHFNEAMIFRPWKYRGRTEAYQRR